MRVRAEEFGLKVSLVEEIIGLAEKYKIGKVTVFGSRARGDYKERSDIDLAIEGGNTDGFACDVQEETSTLLMFDVVDLSAPVQKNLLDSIEREGKLLYEKI